MRLVGYSTLKEIVDETTEIIEKMCIEAALEMSGINRRRRRNSSACRASRCT